MRPTVEQLKQMVEDGSLVKQYENMAYKIAHEIQGKHPQQNFEDLVQEGFLSILENLEKYDANRSTLSTWMYLTLWGQMKNVALRQEQYRHIFMDPKDMQGFSCMGFSWISEILSNLSTDAQMTVQLILGPGHRNLKCLRNKLRKQGWNDEKINFIFQEIKSCL